MPNKIPVTVVIPCFRCKSTITRAINSIALQTKKPVEIILIDDASGDGTIDVLKLLNKQYGDWIRVVELPKNVGAASARNVGWNLATQPYIAFLDADDAWHEQKLEIQYQYMKNNPNITISGHLFRELSPNFTGKLNWEIGLMAHKKITWLQLLLKNQFVTPSVMALRDIPFRFPEGKHHMEDHLLWLEIVGAGLSAIRLNVELAAVYKPMYGASGLSSNMWLMEKAELLNYQHLYLNGKLGILKYIFLQSFSIVKFIRRLIVVYVIRQIYRK